MAPVSAATVRQGGHAKLIRLLLVIVAGAAAAMTFIFFLARPFLGHPTDQDVSRQPARSQALFEEGERQLRDGNVFLARERLNAALGQYRRQPQALDREQRRRFEQLQRQADVLAHLLDQPLEEIVQQALQHHNDQEWNEKFQTYRARTVVFDDVLRLEAPERPVLGSYVVRVGDIEARVALEDLTLLRQLPLDPPRRWVFGARLDSCRREQGGIWVFRFQPNSAVLLSDAVAAAVCCPPPVDKDKELLEVLTRQDEWLRR